jgi:hypothetical protein
MVIINNETRVWVWVGVKRCARAYVRVRVWVSCYASTSSVSSSSMHCTSLAHLWHISVTSLPLDIVP